MSFLSKIELKKQLKEMGIKIEGNYVRKSDLVFAVDKGHWDKNFIDKNTHIPKIGQTVFVAVNGNHIGEFKISKVTEILGGSDYTVIIDGNQIHSFEVLSTELIKHGNNWKLQLIPIP